MKFGVAVDILASLYGIDIPNHSRDIKKHIKDNPNDYQMKVAWQVYTKHVNLEQNEQEVERKPRYFWYATDTVKKEKYKATRAIDLANKLGVSESFVVNSQINRRLVKGRYKITRKKAQRQ